MSKQERDILRALRDWFSSKPNLMLDSNKDLHDDSDKSLNRWKNAGEPYLWIECDRIRNYILLSDVGYGKLALFNGKKIISAGNGFVQSENMNIIGLGETYGLLSPRLYISIPEKG